MKITINVCYGRQMYFFKKSNCNKNYVSETLSFHQPPLKKKIGDILPLEKNWLEGIIKMLRIN